MRRVYLTYLGNSMELPEGETIVGRSLSCRMRFNDSAVSRKHIEIQVTGGDVVVRDLSSRNGTFVNGEPLSGSCAVGNGDELMVGSRRMRILVTDESSGFDEVPTETMSQMPGVDAPMPEDTGGIVSQVCPECKEPVSIEDDLCANCGFSWADFRPLSVTKKVEAGHLEEIGRRERRRHARHRVELPIMYTSDNLTVESMALDLSRSGVFVRTSFLDEVGTHCKLTLMVDGGPALAFHGRVCRVVERESATQPLGLGIEFCDLTNNARRWLDDTLARVGSA